MWEIDNFSQLISFFRALLLGGIFCFLYDIIRALSNVCTFSKLVIFILDFLYFVLISPVIFCFLLSTTNGELRGFIFLGILLGFFVFKILVSRFLLKVLIIVFKFIKKVLDAVKGFFQKVLAIFDRICAKMNVKVKNILKKDK